MGMDYWESSLDRLTANIIMLPLAFNVYERIF